MGRNFTGLLYSDSVIFCFLVLCVILYKAIKKRDLRKPWRAFIAIVITTLVVQLAELLWGLGENGYFKFSITWNYIINEAYFIFTTIDSYLCFYYAQTILETKASKSRMYRMICEIPLFEITVFIALTFWTKMVFYIDETNHYHRGEYTPVHYVISYGYILICLIQTVGAIRNKENFQRRKEYKNIFYFIGITGLFCCLQLFVEGIPLVSMGMTAGILLVYLNSEEMLISIDNLTQLSNRNQLYKHLGAKMQGDHDSKNLYLVLIDVDYFKGINDKYGHVEGDNALKRVADALRKACDDRKTMVCRFGGDEFIIVCDDMKEREVKALISRAGEILAQLNFDAKAPYHLTMSMGYAKCTSQIKYIPEFIEAADQELYKIKRARDRADTHYSVTIS